MANTPIFECRAVCNGCQLYLSCEDQMFQSGSLIGITVKHTISNYQRGKATNAEIQQICTSVFHYLMNQAQNGKEAYTSAVDKLVAAMERVSETGPNSDVPELSSITAVFNNIINSK